MKRKISRIIFLAIMIAFPLRQSFGFEGPAINEAFNLMLDGRLREAADIVEPFSAAADPEAQYLYFLLTRANAASADDFLSNGFFSRGREALESAAIQGYVPALLAFLNMNSMITRSFQLKNDGELEIERILFETKHPFLADAFHVHWHWEQALRIKEIQMKVLKRPQHTFQYIGSRPPIETSFPNFLSVSNLILPPHRSSYNYKDLVVRKIVEDGAVSEAELNIIQYLADYGDAASQRFLSIYYAKKYDGNRDDKTLETSSNWYVLSGMANQWVFFPDEKQSFMIGRWLLANGAGLKSEIWKRSKLWAREKLLDLASNPRTYLGAAAAQWCISPEVLQKECIKTSVRAHKSCMAYLYIDEKLFKRFLMSFSYRKCREIRLEGYLKKHHIYEYEYE